MELKIEPADRDAWIDRLVQKPPEGQFMRRPLKQLRLAMREQIVRRELMIELKAPA